MSIRGVLAALLLLAFGSLIGAIPALAQGAGSAAPVNPRFLDYVQKPAGAREAALVAALSSGLVPEPILLPRVTRLFAAAALPVTYDLRTLGKLTPIRDQGNCGSCWAFAACGSLESCLLPSETWDFSENNLKNTHGFNFPCCDGGNRSMATAYLARWSGPISESDDPYSASGCGSPSGLSPRKHIQDVIYLPDRASATDNASIKQAVMSYGAVYTTYYHEDAYYNSFTKSYYCPSTSSDPNHAVCIVGWDDNYPASNFLTAPPGNGAFIIRNSWGTWWGQSGYFYMSYYDCLLGKTENAAFNAAEPPYNYGEIYGYDDLGWTNSYGYNNDTAWFAMLFTAATSSTLQAVAFYTPVPNSSYEVRIYRGPKANKPMNGTQVSSRTGTIAYAGYHTITLTTSVPMTAGTKYSVVVKLTTPGYNYPVPTETPIAGYSSTATASPGETYISSTSSSWTDLNGVAGNSSVCLKALATVPGELSVSGSGGTAFYGGVGGAFGPTGQSFTLVNTGSQSVNWTASASQPWIGLSGTLGTLAVGASATVNVSTASSANSLLPGTHSGTITFTNTTNGVGSTTRPVSLTIGQNAATIGSLKGMADGSLVTVRDKSITAVFGDCIYIEDSSRISGIRVAPPWPGLNVGDVVTVTGVLGTRTPDSITPCEREIQNAGVVKTN